MTGVPVRVGIRAEVRARGRARCRGRGSDVLDVPSPLVLHAVPGELGRLG